MAGFRCVGAVMAVEVEKVMFIGVRFRLLMKIG